MASRRQQAQDVDPVWNPVEAAAYIGVSPVTLKDWRAQARGPAFYRLGGKLIRYRKSALDAYLSECEVTSNASAEERFGRRYGR